MIGTPGAKTLQNVSWRPRHRVLTVVLAFHGPGIWIYANLLGESSRYTSDVGIALVAVAFIGRWMAPRSQTGASLITAGGLAAASAVVVALSGSSAPASFHTLLIFSIVALYQERAAFTLVVAIGLISTTLIGAPLLGTTWAVANLLALGVAGVVNLAGWRLAESSRDREDQAARRSQLILAAATEGVYGIDRNGLLTFINPSASRMLGWPEADLVGQRMHLICHHTRPDGRDYPPEECPIWRSIHEGTTSRVVDEVFWRRDGTNFPVRYTGTPLIEHDEIVGAVVTFEDRSERARAAVAEAEVSRLVELEKAQRDVLTYLQETIRPPKPIVPAAALGVHYLPSDDGAPTGGDLYDWQMLPDGNLHIAVVDVAGKGVAATKDALAVGHALRLLSLSGRPLNDVIAAAGDLVTAQSPEVVATAVVAHYHPESGVARVVGASHPPPLLVRANGSVEEVPAPGIAIGWPGMGSELVTEVKLERNDSLLLYTDGLIEASKNIELGLMEVEREAAMVSRYPPDLMARALVERMLERGSRRDDTLVVVLRRRTPPPQGGAVLGPFSHRFTPHEAVVPLARHLLIDWLDHQPVAPEDVEDLPLIVSELCANAVSVASTEVVLRAWAEGDSLFIEVEDDGGVPPELARPGLEPEVPDVRRENGRGLFLAEQLADQLEVRSENGRTIVTAVRRAVIG